ncbi:phosphotransferase [Candidatus Woesearchaeota archaeon]|nr:phosphotransferase [Candidatus Woesearchaeota archaeon]
MMMKQVNPLERITYDGVEEGDYEIQAYLAASFGAPASAPKTLSGNTLDDALSDSCDGCEKQESLPQSDALPKSFRSSGPKRMSSASPRSASLSFGRSASSSKPEGVLRLENVLSQAYQTPVSITRVRELRVTKKEVKEVFFSLNGGITKAWVFKADPKKTTRELIAYQIVYEQGVPTGKPIGFKTENPNANYPFDVAVLGGVVEHAGEPYNEFLRNMELDPKLVFETGLNVVKRIAEYQVKLTLALEEFKRRGVDLETASPKKELKNRLLLALRINEKNAGGLIKACEALYKKQSGVRVVSHEDIHTGNIVTVTQVDPGTNLPKTSFKHFGFIDWEEIGLDNPFSDVVDFCLHHDRQALKVCDGYKSDFRRMKKVYSDYFTSLATVNELKVSAKLNNTDSLIQTALWNLYEMYDPVRIDKQDIEEKARLHCKTLIKNLNDLEKKGFKEAEQIRRELRGLLGREKYLSGILK